MFSTAEISNETEFLVNYYKKRRIKSDCQVSQREVYQSRIAKKKRSNALLTCLISRFAGCHTKVHKDHFDKNEEFLGYCKGESNPPFNMF